MQRTIWKFPLRLIAGPQMIKLPKGACVRQSGIDPATGGPAIWAECFVPDNGQPDQADREFYIFGTGDKGIDPALCYHATIFDRQFVWHIFERII